MIVPMGELIDNIKGDLEMALSGVGGFSYAEVLDGDITVSDATTKIYVYNKSNVKVAFLLCGYSQYSDINRRHLLNNQNFKSQLSKDSGSVFLEPFLVGYVAGIDYTIWPICEPLGSNTNFFLRKIQEFKYQPLVLKWLRTVNKESQVLASDSEVINDFIIPLQELFERDGVQKKLKEEIKCQINNLQDCSWRPLFVLAHNDFWEGNVLIDPKSMDNKYKGLTIIDWAGGSYRGFAIFDLVRMALSLGLSKSAFQNELQLHCKILSCDKRQAMGYLLASFAFLSNNLGEFPEERFLQLLHKCFNYLDKKL